jgi:hypothetical protein
MDRLDPLALDRELRRTAERWRSWRRAVSRGEGFDGDPFAMTRSAVGQTTFRRIADEIDSSDPLVVPLRRWVYRLAEQRIDAETLVEIERLRRVERHALDEPVEDEFTLAAMLLLALREPGRRGAWVEQIVERAEPLTTAVRQAHAATVLDWRRSGSRRRGTSPGIWARPSSKRQLDSVWPRTLRAVGPRASRCATSPIG